MNKPIRHLASILVVAIAVFALVVGGYVLYLSVTYSRIPDGESIDVLGNVDGTTIATNKEYTALTYNIGFGAYTPDYLFFMDEGIMKDGTKTVGKHSIASSKESVQSCTNGAIDVIALADPDFALLQEVDVDSTRSYGVNQKEAIRSAFSDMGAAFASNFHTAFLAYPITEPHGIVNAGLLSLTGTHVDSEVATCRGADIPFTQGVNYQVTIDGFIVSNNVKARAANIETNYAYSDHNPVELTFTLAK